MTIIHWNIRGLKSNYEQLQLLSRTEQPVVWALQETKLIQDKTIPLSGFHDPLYQLAHPTELGFTGGVSLYIKKSVLFSPVSLTTPLQAIAARVTLDQTITICSLYLSPSETVSRDSLIQLIDQLPQPFLLLGDMNGHSPLWGSSTTSPRGLLLEDVFGDRDLCVLNKQSPTYFHSASGTFSYIDLSVCDPSLFLNYEWSAHDDLCGSDHFPIKLTPINTEEESQQERFQFKRANWELFQIKVRSELEEETILQAEDPVECLTEIIMKCAKETIPTSSGQKTLPKTPWFNKECQQIHKERKKAQRLVFQHPTPANVRAHQALRAKSRYVFKSSKRQSWKDFCSKLNSKTPISKVWKTIKKIKGKNNTSSVHHLKINNTLITDRQAVTNLLASTISKNSSSSNRSTAFLKFKQLKEKTSCDFSSDNSETYNLPFTLDELKSVLQTCSDSSAGPDGIHYSLIRHLPDSCLDTVLKVYNHIWITDFFPPSWRKAVVVPIPKPGKDLSNPSNYRPIALTSCLCKVMEKMVNCRLMWKLETEGLLAKEQCGFRKHRSTVDHLIRFESAVRNAFVNKQHAIAIFFDLEKAYDTTWRYGILSDLHNFGFRGLLPKFLEKFLEVRTFQVRVGSTLSDIYEQELGVPQGSILSPALFSIKINSIVQSVNKESDSSLFVDDFALYATGKSFAKVQRQLQLCVNKIGKWALENGFKFSTGKTQCIHFHNPRVFFPDPVINLEKTSIKVVTEAKFLGITFDKKLNFLSHIQKLKTSCLQALNILRVVAHTDWGADKKTLLHLYRALVRSKLDYGCMIYGSARPSYLKALDPIHHQGLRLCLGAFRTTPVHSLYAEAGEPSLKNRRLKLSLNYYLKLFSEPLNPAYDCVFDPDYKEKFENNPNCIPPFGLRMLPHIQNANIDLGVVSDFSKFPDEPPWTFETPVVNFDLSALKKDTTSSAVYKAYYSELCEKLPSYIEIFTDGSKSEEGVACAAVCSSRQPFTMRLPNDSSIYTAELAALLLALKIIYQSNHKNFLIFSDSLSALEAISMRNISHPLLMEFHELYSKLSNDGYNIVLAWIPGHVGIRGNEVADRIAKDAVTEDISSTLIPYSDLKPKIHKYIHEIWQNEWEAQSDNKLFQVRPKLTDHLLSVDGSRKEESVLCRLHTGHSYLTHSYLLKNEDIPWCIACDERLTIKHILLDCWDVYDIRRKHFTASSMKILFRDVPPDLIFNFLKEIKVFFKL